MMGVDRTVGKKGYVKKYSRQASFVIVRHISLRNIAEKDAFRPWLASDARLGDTVETSSGYDMN